MVLYKLKDFLNEDITGSFYQSELQRVTIKDDKLWKVEKIIRKRKRKGVQQYYVKYKGWPNKFNQWITDLK